jgi:hypothetical protein
MFKTHKIDVRLSADEFREIERTARTLNISKSQYIRLLLSGGALQKSQPREDSPLVAKIETALSDMRTELAEIRELLVSISRSFESLLAFLREAQRIPTFREFRSRCSAENITKPEIVSDIFQV